MLVSFCPSYTKSCIDYEKRFELNGACFDLDFGDLRMEDLNFTSAGRRRGSPWCGSSSGSFAPLVLAGLCKCLLTSSLFLCRALQDV